MGTDMIPLADPPPVPPEKPLPGDCCYGGCAVCVWDAYADALSRYQAELAAWRARCDPSAGSGQERDGRGS